MFYLGALATVDEPEGNGPRGVSVPAADNGDMRSCWPKKGTRRQRRLGRDCMLQQQAGGEVLPAVDIVPSAASEVGWIAGSVRNGQGPCGS